VTSTLIRIRKGEDMYCQLWEPSLAEALADPIVKAMMKADRVDPAALEADLRRIARTIGSSQSAPKRITRLS
jgi:hypothetical protein